MRGRWTFAPMLAVSSCRALSGRFRGKARVKLTLCKTDGVDPLVSPWHAHIIDVIVYSRAGLVLHIRGQNRHDVSPVVVGEKDRDVLGDFELKWSERVPSHGQTPQMARYHYSPHC